MISPPQPATADHTHLDHPFITDTFHPSLPLDPPLPSTSQSESPHDFEPIGDSLSLPKPPNTTRLFYTNPNGFRLGRSGDEFVSFLHEMEAIEAEIICAAEININTHHHPTLKLMKDCVKHSQKLSRLHLSSSPVPSQHAYKPGGVLQLAVGSITGKITQSHTDDLGRWVTQIYSGRASQSIAFITLYRPGQQELFTEQPHRKKSRSVVSQQHSILRSHGNMTHPRTQCLKDLNSHIHTLRSQQHEVLLVGDFNEHVSPQSTWITKIITENHLIDVMHHHIGFDNFKTHVEGSQRIDFVLATPHCLASINNCGYRPFKDHGTGDHRDLYIDFDSLKLFGKKTQQLYTPPHRALQSNDSHNTKLYLEKRYKYLQDHKWFQRMATLKEGTAVEPTVLAEQLDQDWVRACVTGEKSIKKRLSTVYSRTLAHLRAEIRLVRIHCTSFRHEAMCTQPIARIRLQYNLSIVLPPTILESRTLLALKLKELKKLESTHTTLRSKEQQDQIAALIQAGDIKKANLIKRIQKAELVSQTFQKLKSLRSVGAFAALTYIDVPTNPDDDPATCSEWTRLDDPLEIEQALLRRNQAHFGQAHSTPPTIPPLSEDLNWQASTKAASDILEGTYHPPTLDSTSLLLVKELKSVQPRNAISPRVTTQQWISKIRSWSESTSTAGQMHLGHQKAIIPGQPANTLDPDPTEQIKASLLQGQVDLLDFATSHAYSFNRWQQVVNIMIPKAANSPRIHKLRVIHLYAADYQALVSIKWRQQVHLAITNDTINTEQYGSLPGKDAITPVFLEELQMETARITRKPIVKMDYDATACFDRIIPNLASVSSLQHGTHQNIVIINATTLQEATFRLKTALGISESGYKHSIDIPIYGTGQGSGNSPIFWAFLSATLFDIFKANAHGACYSSPSKSLNLTLHMVGYVDDTAGSVNQFNKSTTSADPLIPLMQQDAQLWCNLLHASGGSLNLLKCSYHTVEFEFGVGGAPVMKRSTPTTPITVIDPSSLLPTTFTPLPPTKAHKTLGTYKEPTGSQTEALRQLTAKNSSFISLLSRSFLTRQETQALYHSIYLPSIRYPLPTSYHSKSQMEAVDSKALQAFLPKMGFNRTLPLAIRFGPKHLGGLALSHSWVEQGIAQVLLFLKHWRSSSTASILLRITLAWCQFQSGLGVSILRDTKTPLPHLEAKWIPSLRSFLSHSNGSFVLDDSYIIPTLRDQDCHIMDLAIKSKQFSDPAICQLNYCRLYLQVHTLADITDCKGTRLLPFARPPYSANPNNLLTPIHQAKPGKWAFAVWRKFTLQHFTRTGLILSPLGGWHVNHHCRTQFTHYYDCSANELLVHTPQGYAVHHNSGGSRFRLRPHDIKTGLPALAIPTHLQVATTSLYLIIQRPRDLHTLFPTPPPPDSFPQFLSKLPPWEFSLLRQHEFLLPVDQVVSILLASTTSLGVSDGSVRSAGASFGWILSTPDGVRIARGAGPGFGCKPTSFRSEAYGMLAALTFQSRLLHYYHAPQPQALGRLFTDSESLLNVLRSMLPHSRPFPNQTLAPDWDVLQAIVCKHRHRFQIQMNHVKGHQDDDAAYDDLPLPAQLNVDADHLAGEFTFTPMDALPPHHQLIAGASANLIIENEVITSRYPKHLRVAALSPPLRQYHQLKYRWTKSVYDDVAWDLHGRALLLLSHHQIFLLKYIHNQLPVGSLVNKYDSTYPRVCSTCKQEDETRTHLLQCSMPSRMKWRSDFFSALKKVSDTYHLHPTLLDILINSLDCYFHDTHFDTAGYLPDHTLLVESQTAIGWDQLLLGRFSKAWINIQDCHLRNINLRSTTKSGASTVGAIIRTIFERVQLLWRERNGDRHGSDTTSAREALHAQLLRETEALYNIQPQVLRRDCNIYYSSFLEHTLVEKTTSALQGWLNAWRPVLLASQLSASQTGLISHPTIDSFFPTPGE